MNNWFQRTLQSLLPDSSRSKRRRSARRRSQVCPLRVEPLETRRMLASDMMGVIDGTVFNDLTADGLTIDDTLIPNVEVQLWRDGGDNTFGGSGVGSDDVDAGSVMTDASGRYEFEDLAAGRYFVEQIAEPGFVMMPNTNVRTVDISAGDAMGVTGITIDDFDTIHNVMASSAGPVSVDSFMDAAVLGGEQDLTATVTAGAGTIDVISGFLFDGTPGSGFLQLSAAGSARGSVSVIWDGDDDDGATIDFTGLGNVDLTDSGGDLMTAFSLMIGAEDPDAELTIQVYSDAGRGSEMTVAIPVTGGDASESVCLHFDQFTAITGLAVADFSDVGAVVMTVTNGTTDPSDVQVAINGTIGPTVFTEDFANFEPLTIGNAVFNDIDDDGVFDPGETGIAGVAVSLYQDSDGTPGLSAGDGPAIQTTTTDASGLYLFENLFPGDFVVQIDQSNFDGGGVLEGLTSSTGNAPTPDPDDDVDDDDNGDPLAGQGVVSQPVTLSIGGEPTNDGDADNNTNLSVDFGFVTIIDLQVVKSDNPDSVVAGTALTYTMIVTNNGPATATGVTMTDTLPAGVSYVSGSSSQGPVVEAGGVVTATIGTLTSGSAVTVTVNVTVGAGVTGTILNTAAVTGNETETITANNNDDEETTVVAQADLGITKSDDIDPNTPGQPLVYTLNVTNNGPSDATGVTVVDTLPAGVTFVTATPSQGTFSEAGGVVTAVLGNLAAGASASVVVNVTIDAGTAGTINNTATVSGNETDTNAANDSATEPTVIAPQIDLQIEKDDSADPVAPGDNLTYTLLVTNNGPSQATGVTVTDTLPAGITVQTVNTSQGSGSEAGGVVTANLGNIDTGQTATVTIITTVDAATLGTLTNVATVAANEAETNNANNMDTETTVVSVDPASISGRVFIDFDNDGQVDSNDIPLSGVVVNLTGNDLTGAPVTASVTTASDGTYLFSNLNPGTYRVDETQPALFPDGMDTIGSEGGTTLNDAFDAIVLSSGTQAVEYNFAELPPTLSKRRFLASSV